eukprot:365494-Chlamydomonas_euryale.AAC.6
MNLGCVSSAGRPANCLLEHAFEFADIDLSAWLGACTDTAYAKEHRMGHLQIHRLFSFFV